jgi:two-component system NtrC family sensor kinase
MSPYSLEGKKILVVDDDPVILETIHRMLKNAGMDPCMVCGGEEALTRLRQETPDIILLDYMMPVMDGVAVYRKIREDRTFLHCRDVPVIMLTAKTDNQEEQKELLEMGLSAYLLKPFGYKELMNVMANVVTLNTVKVENLKLHGQIQEMKDYLQSIFDGIKDPISVQDSQFHIQRYNRATARTFLKDDRAGSFEAHTAAGAPCHKVYFERDTVCEHCPAAISFHTGQPHWSEIKDARSQKHYQISTYPIMSSSGKVNSVIETIKDITEKKELESQLIESSKLASIGTLAAGVAHEINNPLCIILGFTQSLLAELEYDHIVHKDLKIIEEETARCGRVVQDLLTYARPGRLEKSKANPVEIMQKSLRLGRHLMKKKEIVVTENYAPDVPAIWMDPQKIQQVFVNMLLNAMDSMLAGGRLDIAIVAHENAISVQIKDTGSGISEENIKRIFDPFFTSKIGRGTGLGLSICQSIIHEHAGTIRVKSKVGEGTEFTITLPIEKLN